MKKETKILRSERFEDYLSRVEKIVADLEEGNLPLEDSLAKYEAGVKALRQCYEILQGMEKRIEILVKDQKGQRRAQPFKKPRTEEGND